MLDSVIDGKKSETILNELQAKETKIRYGLSFCYAGGGSEGGTLA
jgi:hypothetical protein